MSSSPPGEEAIPKGRCNATLRRTYQSVKERETHVASLSGYVIVELVLQSAKTQDVANVTCKSS